MMDLAYPAPNASTCRVCRTTSVTGVIKIANGEEYKGNQLPRSAARAPELRDVVWDRVAVTLVARLTGRPGVTKLWLRWDPEDGTEAYVIGLDGFVVERLKAIDALLPEAAFPNIAYAGPGEELASDVLLAEFT